MSCDCGLHDWKSALMASSIALLVASMSSQILAFSSRLNDCGESRHTSARKRRARCLREVGQPGFDSSLLLSLRLYCHLLGGFNLSESRTPLRSILPESLLLRVTYGEKSGVSWGLTVALDFLKALNNRDSPFITRGQRTRRLPGARGGRYQGRYAREPWLEHRSI